jgi:hypothetical protein
MQGVTTLHESGFEKTIFESVTDTLAGGATLDPTGLSAIFTDGVVPAGTLVGVKDETTGLHKVVTITDASPDTYDVEPLGFTMASVKIDNNPLVGVALGGVVRKALLSAGGGAITSGQITDLKDNLPKFTFV